MILLALLLLACLASIAIGSKTIPLPAIWQTFNGGTDESINYVIWQLRFPRTVAGIAVGAALGVAGALIQAFSRNPLADPGILGVNAGAAFFVVIGTGFFGVSALSGQLWFALAGACVVTLMVYLVGTAGRGRTNPIRLTLAGVALAAVLTGISTAIVIGDQAAFYTMRAWNAGSLAGRDLSAVGTVIVVLTIGLTLALALGRSLNALALGDELAAGLGAKVGRTRLLTVLAVTLLAGGATALTGPIGFLGLMSPHIARWITGPHQVWIICYSALIGPVVLIGSDVLARIILPNAEVPVGVLTAFIGAPVLIALVRRRKASGL